MRPDHAAYIASWLTVLKNDKRFIFTAAAMRSAPPIICTAFSRRRKTQPPDAVLRAMEDEPGPFPDAVAAAWHVIMTLPRFIEIDGRRYLWRELVALRRAQATPRPEQPTLFPLREDCRPAGERTPPSATESRACSRCLSAPDSNLPGGEGAVFHGPLGNRLL